VVQYLAQDLKIFQGKIQTFRQLKTLNLKYPKNRFKFPSKIEINPYKYESVLDEDQFAKKNFPGKSNSVC